jgi:hypothetical protein
MFGSPDRRYSNRAPPLRLSGDGLSLHPHRTNRKYPERPRVPLYQDRPSHSLEGPHPTLLAHSASHSERLFLPHFGHCLTVIHLR